MYHFWHIAEYYASSIRFKGAKGFDLSEFKWRIYHTKSGHDVFSFDYAVEITPLYETF